MELSRAERRALMESEFHRHFGSPAELFVQAPGRVDLLGSHTDYNQGYVLTQAIDLNTWIAAKPRADDVVRIASMNTPGSSQFELADIQYDAKVKWSNYVRGVAQLIKQDGNRLHGFDGLVHSTIPFGSGLSSSAALEVASAFVFQLLAAWQLEPLAMARLCQRAENEFVGMNCGILDQYSSVFGQEDNTLLLDCRSLTNEFIPISEDVRVMVCDTRTARELTGSEYAQRRAQCEQGAAILRRSLPEIDSLRDVSLEQLADHRGDLGSLLYKRCRFIVEENKRVLDLAEAIAHRDYRRAGRLMNDSFAGARDLFEIVSAEMQSMQEAIMAAPGTLGGRGAGAGFGGCLVALVEAELAEDFAASVRQGYLATAGIDPKVFPVRAAAGAGELSFTN